MFFVSSSKGFYKVPFGLNQELLDRALLVYLLASHRQIQITVMFDWVTAGVEQRGVPVAQCLVAFGGVKRQAANRCSNLFFLSDSLAGEIQCSK